MKSKYSTIDTPSLLIDREIMMKNIHFMQACADQHKVNFRPHAKTHKMPKVCQLQIEAGAVGIAVAKVGEAEVMAENGVKDIFIATQIVGVSKIERIKELSKKINISLGIDNGYQVEQINEVFGISGLVANVLIEIEIGENRSGIVLENDFKKLIRLIKSKSHVNLLGIYAHDGHSYHAKSIENLREIFLEGQRRTLMFADIAKDLQCPLQVVSIGSTPPFMFDFDLLDGITEIRLGTYVFMDVSQGNIIGTYEKCAASVITTVISKPTDCRIITDSGAKALTSQSRSGGLCETVGKGYIKGTNKIYLDSLFDEHGIVYNKALSDTLEIGDKIEIIPNHICPVCNLYDVAYVVDKGHVVDKFSIDARGKLL